MKFIKVTIDQIVPDAWNLSPEGNVLAWSPITNVIAVCTPNVIHLLRPMISPLREPFFERGYISHAVTGNIGNYSQVCWQTEPGSP